MYASLVFSGAEASIISVQSASRELSEITSIGFAIGPLSFALRYDDACKLHDQLDEVLAKFRAPVREQVAA